MQGSREDVKKCPSYWCFLWPYRLGHQICIDPEGEKTLPRRPKRDHTDEQRAQVREAAERAQLTRNGSQKQRTIVREDVDITPPSSDASAPQNPVKDASPGAAEHEAEGSAAESGSAEEHSGQRAQGYGVAS